MEAGFGDLYRVCRLGLSDFMHRVGLGVVWWLPLLSLPLFGLSV